MNPHLSFIDPSWLSPLRTFVTGKLTNDNNISEISFSEAEKRVVKCFAHFSVYKPYWELLKDLKLIDKPILTW